MKTLRCGRVLAGAFVLLALVAADVTAAPKAGEVVTVAGRAAAATEEGDIRALSRGGDINSGETVVTSRNSFVRLKFVDGAYVILRPNTRFHIEDYQLADKPEENRSFFNLVKGGFRTVTGLVGKRNRAGYRVRTAVATIGIRGTDFEVRHCEGPECDGKKGTFAKVNDADEDGGIYVETAAGTKNYQQGQYVHIANRDDPSVEIPEEAADPLTDDPLTDAACN